MTEWRKLTKLEKVECIKQHWKPGSSALDLAKRSGATSRGSVIGIYTRHREELKNHPLEGRPPPLSRDERLARRRELDRARYHGKRSNVVKLRIPRFKKPVGDRTIGIVAVRSVEPPVRIVSNNIELMVKDYIAKNGARRFERGAVTEYTAITNFLRERGYELKGHARGRMYTLVSPVGKNRALMWPGVLQVVDKLRIEEGKEPFMKEAS